LWFVDEGEDITHKVVGGYLAGSIASLGAGYNKFSLALEPRSRVHVRSIVLLPIHSNFVIASPVLALFAKFANSCFEFGVIFDDGLGMKRSRFSTSGLLNFRTSYGDVLGRFEVA
jgi:hypothetical protein